MAGKYERRRKIGVGWMILPLLLCAAVLCSLIGRDAPAKTPEETTAAADTSTAAATEPMETEAPTTEPVTKVATATIGATGDILLHDLVIQSGYDAEAGDYNYDYMFQWFTRYVSRVDYAVANLEVTLVGNENGRKYSGYPTFNAPDAIVDALKTAGFDLLLTANNHAYDTGYEGFMRTQQVIRDRELAHIGTREKVEDKNYLVQEINGIRIGMTCYTYCSGHTSAGTPMLNGLKLNTEASKLANTFHYKRLEDFYGKLAGEMEQMKADGAEAIVLFIHWGDEYKTSPNETQQKMAQRLCDMGVDVIIGNHAHVAQPVQLLTSRETETHKTLCLYSTGNSVSNIYGNKNHPPHTEDGMLFTFTFAKYSDGTVLVESADVIPTWVWRYDEDGVRKFKILTLEDGLDWAADMGLDEEPAEKCRESFDRTMDILGPGLEEANTWFAENQTETENQLGVQ